MAMKISEQGIALIKSFESCKLTAYKALSTEEYYTIGWGHYGADVKTGQTISQDEADALFLSDLQQFVKYTNTYTKTLTLNQNQFDALVSFCYNCGPGTLKKLVNGRTAEEIAEHFTDYTKSKGKVIAGLVRRRQEEKELFCKGSEVKSVAIKVGSARINEKGGISGGTAGDQKQVSSVNDTIGEVSMQAMYTHSKGWYISRPKSVEHANAIAERMVKACNNPNIGYDQVNRLGIVTYGTGSKTKIGFTVSEEFREIGVMKAVGIDNGSIRSLYIVKYFAIAVVGTLIGYFCSVPLGDMMMKTVSENIVLGSESGTLMGLLSSGLVVIIILLFCYGCTRRVNKLSPIDAVRNGQTGERFRRKSLLHLGHSKLPQAAFLSVNDVISSPKQFSIMIVVFALCILLMTIMSNFALTLKSEKILRFFDVPSSEAHIMDSEIFGEVILDQSTYKQIIPDIEKLLADNGMPGKCTITMCTQFETSHEDKTAKIAFSVMKGETNDTLYVDKGSAPQKTDEIAVTVSTLGDLEAEIGDRVTAIINEKEYEFIITGTYSSFDSHAAFLYKDFDLGNLPANNIWGVQIHFDGNPNKEQISQNIEKLGDLLDTDKVYSTSDFIKNFTGISDTLNAIKQMMMIITVIVTALIVILMERSFISKEKSEIALMKAVGVGNGSIILQHSLRFAIVSVIACIISTAVLMPISDVMMNWVCKMIGDVSGMKCDFDPLEIFVICPAILIGVTVIGSFLTALYTKTINASDTASIE